MNKMKQLQQIGAFVVVFCLSVACFPTVEAKHYVECEVTILRVIDGDTFEIKIKDCESINKKENLNCSHKNGCVYEIETLRWEGINALLAFTILLLP